MILRLALAIFLSTVTAGPSTFSGPNALEGTAATIPSNGLQLWYRGDSLTCTGGCTGTNTVTAFVDLSGNSNTATNSIGTATFLASAVNGQPGVTFPGSQALFNFGTAVNLQTASTMFAVLKTTTTTSDSGIISGGAGSILYRFSNSAGGQQALIKSNVALIGRGTAAADTSYHQTNYTYDGTTVTFRRDRASDGSTGGGVAITATETLIGKDLGSNGSVFVGVMAEIIVYNRVLNAAEITVVENYLNARYAL